MSVFILSFKETPCTLLFITRNNRNGYHYNNVVPVKQQRPLPLMYYNIMKCRQ